MKLQQAFSQTYKGRTLAIYSSVNILNSGDNTETNEQYNALWDTGASLCAIKQNIAEKLNLTPIDLIEVNHADGKKTTYRYLVDIILPNKVRINQVPVCAFSESDNQWDCILGMNIITLGDFAITNSNDKTLFSFEFPSTQSIDFVKEINDQNKRIILKTPRNAPCPCKSGKKFKDCCIKKYR